jgi:F0F1-type ATP synthase assembly protein I
LILGRRRGTGTPPIDRDEKNMWRIAGTTGAVGIEIAVAIGIGYFGGNYLDRKFGTAPWLLYVGLLAGIGAAIKALVRVTRYYRRNFGDDQATKSDAAPPDQKD